MPTSQPGTDFLQSVRMGKAGNACFCSVAMMSVFCPNRDGVMGKALRPQWIFYSVSCKCQRQLLIYFRFEARTLLS